MVRHCCARVVPDENRHVVFDRNVVGEHFHVAVVAVDVLGVGVQCLERPEVLQGEGKGVRLGHLRPANAVVVTSPPRLLGLLVRIQTSWPIPKPRPWTWH